MPEGGAYGQLRFWAAGEPACESETWPQALFLFVSTDLLSNIGRNSRFLVINQSKSTDIVENQLETHQFGENPSVVPRDGEVQNKQLKQSLVRA